MDVEMRILANPDEVASKARTHVLALLEARVKEHGKASLALSGGSTPALLYAVFAKHQDVMPHVELYYGDERAVPPDHPDSNHGMVERTWLGPAAVDPTRVHRFLGEAPDLDAEAARYQDVLLHHAPQGLDVLLLGMGDDGHTCSIFPGTPAATEQHLLAMALHAGAPKHKRLTLTPVAVKQAAHVVVLITGTSKADMLKRALYDAVDATTLPIQLALRGHRSCLLLCDQAAAASLKAMRM